MKQLWIVGAGGFGREVYSWASAHPDCGVDWEIAGFLDDNPAALDGFDYPVGISGTVKDHLPGESDCYVCGLGIPEVKQRVCRALLARSACFITLVHPSAILGKHVRLGTGVVLCPRVTLTCDAEVGDFVSVNCHSSAGHDVKIGAWSTVSGHCDITGGCELGEMAFLGSGVRILPKRRVGVGAYVGAGSVVLQSVADAQRVFGVPARRID